MNKNYIVSDANFDKNQLNDVGGIQYEKDVTFKDVASKVGGWLWEKTKENAKELVNEVMTGK